MTLGNDVDIRRLVFVRLHRFSIGANTILSYGCQIKGEAGFSCEDSCFLGVHCLIHCVEDVSFGRYTGLGPRCMVYTHGSFLPATQGYPVKFAPVVLEDHVWVAMGVTIMAGAHIERNCIINPHVVVQGRIKSDSIVQIDPQTYSVHDLSRLQLVSKKDTATWHDRIIRGFLGSLSVPFQHDEESARYTVPGKYTFVSITEANAIELHIGRSRILYDLEGFTACQSRRRIHKKFMAFIRLHFGLTLKTQYR
jgi:acetyltransferase-like isoleucine patch superfamily enzyme